MKKLALLACALLLTGCSVKQPATTHLNLQITELSTGIYTDSSATIRGEDARKSAEVAVYQLKDKPAVKITNMSAPHILITERLAGGLREQGLKFDSNSDARILLNLNELLVTITKPKLLYVAEAKSQVTLKVVNGSSTLTKKYDREANRESARRPDIRKLEKMLNNQLSDIVNQILKDEDIRAAISAK